MVPVRISQDASRPADPYLQPLGINAFPGGGWFSGGFQMWDAAYREIRRIAPDAQIVGRSLAFTPQNNPGEWSTWLSHVEAAGTIPDMITDRDEGDVDDPVAVSQSLDSALAVAGIGARPLPANKYRPADRQTAGGDRLVPDPSGRQQRVHRLALPQ